MKCNVGGSCSFRADMFVVIHVSKVKGSYTLMLIRPSFSPPVIILQGKIANIFDGIIDALYCDLRHPSSCTFSSFDDFYYTVLCYLCTTWA